MAPAAQRTEAHLAAGAWASVRPPLSDWVLSALSEMQFADMTPVQASAIPLFLSHKDVVAEAVTGSGKTLAFVIPVLEILRRREDPLKKGQVGAVIVCPTRELAQQTASVVANMLEWQPGGYARGIIGHTPRDEEEGDDAPAPDPRALRGVQLCVGGTRTSPADDYVAFCDEGAEILVGTPGRLEELLRKPGVRKSELEVLVLDEADRLLDLGFAATLRTLLGYLPKQRRTGLFSATMTEALSELVRVGLRNPVRVVVKVEQKGAKGLARGGGDMRLPATLQNYYHVSRPEHKLAQLLRILRYEAQPDDLEHASRARKFIVYFATCAQVNYLYPLLARYARSGGDATQALQFFSLHGKQSPKRRHATFHAFTHAHAPGTDEAAAESDATPAQGTNAAVLLCTDVAARGLDLPDVDVVVQYDPPSDPKVFSHRCGRTARAGRQGRAIVMLNRGREENYVEFLQIKQLPLAAYPFLGATAKGPTPAAEPVETDPTALDLERALRRCVREDRALYELGIRAFVSWVKAYSKHEVSFIFRLDDVPLDAAAFAFALLHLPKMPEVARWRERQRDVPSLLEEEQVDQRAFAYADKQREKQRLAALERADAEPSPAPQPTRAARREAWSEQKLRKDTRDARREKKERKRRWLHEQRTAASAAPAEEEEEDDWAAEERAAKKLKQGKLSQTEFDADFFDTM